MMSREISNQLKSRLYKAVFPFLFCMASCFQLVRAQEVTATLKADSNHILIGDFLKVNLSVKFPADMSVVMPPVADTLGSMEVVKISNPDTEVNGNFKTITHAYIVSAYDSGIFSAGPQKIVFSKDGIRDSIFSDSLLITVTTVPVDTAKAFKPIKKPIEVPYTWSEFLPYVITAILLAGIVIAVVYYVRKRRRRKPKIINRPKPKDPAHVWAKRELKKLEEEKLWQKDQIKLYYSRLTEILRLYLEYRYNWFALESTTEEITQELGSYEVSDDARKDLLMILNEADLVKFAKRLPMPDTNMKVMENAVEFIDRTQLKEEQVEKPAQ